MDNNPYQADYHKYLESLKASLNKSDNYVNSDHKTENIQSVQQLPQNIKPKTSLVKIVMLSLGFIFIGISAVSFLTQGALFLFSNKNSSDINIEIEKVEDKKEDVYVRADLNKNIFQTTSTTSTSTVATSSVDISNYFNVNIPGVSRIGYDESLGNQFLTDNINKYSNTTLVIGDRDDSGEYAPGGGYDETLIDKYDIVEKSILPVLSSRAYLIADLATGEIIFEKNSDTVYPIASVSKLMTAVVATEKMNLQDIAIVSRDATNTYGAQGGLKLGEKIILSDLIYPLLMESSNDAAEVFADHYGRQAFMDEMNKKARSIGMENTYYNDPSGLDPKNSSTPKDLLKLVRYIWENDPSIFAATRVKQFSIKGHTWSNRNAQLPIYGFVGGKNGFIDQALQTTASVFEIPTLKGGTRKVAIVILKSNDKNGDVIKLINFLKKSVVYSP
jgi:hypothetical protein